MLVNVNKYTDIKKSNQFCISYVYSIYIYELLTIN